MARPKKAGDHILRLLKSGASTKQIVSIAGVSKSAVTYHKIKNGLSLSKNRVYQWQSMQRDYDSGMAFREIREKYSIRSDVWSYGVRAGKLVDPPEKKKARLAENGRRRIAEYASVMTDPAVCSKRRYKQLQHEEAQAEKLRADGYEVFSPTVVCDRVAIKDGKVFFVEFKFTGQGLRPGQCRVQSVTPDQYLTIYSDRE